MSDLPRGTTGDILVYKDAGWLPLHHGDYGLALVTRGPGQTPAWTLIQGTLPPGSGQGDLLFWSGLSWTILLPGTDGYLLESNGAGADPSWTNPSTIPVAYTAINAIYAVAATDYQIECTANTFTVTLPTAVGITGKTYSIKNTGAGVITVACDGAETIDSIATQTLNQWDNIVVLSNGASWIII
jgi:hypothetical protein